jgi:porin
VLKNKFTIAFLLGFFAFMSFSVYAQDRLYKKEKSFKFEASYTGDIVNNLSGGIKTGSCYLGMANIRLGFDSEKAGLWRGGYFLVSATNTHGAKPSEELLGDIQIASNIEAGNHTFIQEFFFRQKLHKIELTLGLQDLNIEFANSGSGEHFLNSSYGVLPLISGNISAPIFPLTAFGFTARWNIAENFSWLNAVYDGSPTNFDNNPYNLNWEFASGDGILIISEVQSDLIINKLIGTYKLGYYSHNHFIEESLGNPLPDSLYKNTYGFYSYADQNIWKNNNKSIGLFVQLGFSPSKEVTNDFFIGMGLNYTGIFNAKGRDIFGLAFAQEHFTNGMKSETVIELSYQYQITKNIFLQPDFQYIFNPAGTGETLENAFAGILRFGFNF